MLVTENGSLCWSIVMTNYYKNAEPSLPFAGLVYFYFNYLWHGKVSEITFLDPNIIHRKCAYNDYFFLRHTQSR